MMLVYKNKNKIALAQSPPNDTSKSKHVFAINMVGVLLEFYRWTTLTVRSPVASTRFALLELKIEGFY